MSLHLGVVQDVLVRVAFADTADGPADEVYVLEHGRGAAPTPEWDERRYLELLGAVLSGDTAPPHAVVVRRWHSTWESAHGHAEVSLRVGTAAAGAGSDPRSRQAVLTAFRALLASGPAGAPAAVTRPEAITASRRVVASAWPDRAAGDLALFEEEHRSAEGVWAIGLVAPDGTQYHVEVGVVDGNPAGAHARRTAPAEIVDSVGTE